MAVSVLARTVAGSSIVTALTIEWIDRITITGIDTSILPTDSTKIDLNFLVEAYNLQASIPFLGDMHPKYPDTCCSNIEVRPAPGDKGDSPESVQADIRWLRVRKDKDGDIMHTVQVDQYQSYEIRNFDIDGNKTQVIFSVDIMGIDRKKYPPRIADIRCPRTMFSVKISQYENVKEKEIGQFCQFRTDGTPISQITKLPAYNINEWNGFPANTCLYLGSRLNYVGLPIALRDYFFQTNERGWNKFIAVYQQKDGFVPGEIKDLPASIRDPAVGVEAGIDPATGKPLNGIGVYDMLDEIDFEDSIPLVSNKPLGILGVQ